MIFVMRQFGIKGKINIGFAALFLLLMLSGAISVFELTRSSASGAPAKGGSCLALSLQLYDVEQRIDSAVQELSAGRYGEAQLQMAQADSLAATLHANAQLMEDSRYRSIVPGIIAISAGMVLILLFNYFINYFFVNPLVKITQAVNSTVEYGSPFKVSVDSNDEIGELKEAISQLALQAKKSVKADAEAKPFNSKKA